MNSKILRRYSFKNILYLCNEAVKSSPLISAALLGFLSALLSSSLMIATDWLMAMFSLNIYREVPPSMEVIVGTILGGLFFAPLIETLICQVVVIENLREKFSNRWCIMISAFIFSSIHCISGGGEQCAKMFLLGFILANLYSYVRRQSLTGSFVACCVAHFFHNSIVIFFGLVIDAKR